MNRQKEPKSRVGLTVSPGFTIVELLIVIVIIAILAAITIVAYSGITQQAQSSARSAELSQWKTKSALYRAQNNIDDCPAGYSFVYGNTTLGTQPGFCVMKYEAKNVGGIATSQAAGAPWVSITQPSAASAATAAGGHLLTEAEWMTIAADVLTVKHNWSGGSVGSGLIYQGHVNNNPGSALAASDDDSDSLNGITGGTGTTSGTNSSRVLVLSSGDTIWDLSGNVYEWTSQVQAMSQVGVSGETAFNWRQWNYSSLSLGNLPTVSRPSTLASLPGLSGITGWNSNQGIGQIIANYSDTATRGFLRGGNWGETSPAGVLTLALYGDPSYTSTGVGFRVAR